MDIVQREDTAVRGRSTIRCLEIREMNILSLYSLLHWFSEKSKESVDEGKKRLQVLLPNNHEKNILKEIYPDTQEEHSYFKNFGRVKDWLFPLVRRT